ncbi:hypothetical protein RHMOL_Rhmol03G0268000 [Rhododendron molle]|uniref:Uncharacterized protein n=1 Tax=Rhododendron molle TaxID=49168 RepID=A0ACC0PKA7_RHOML|nr:hypothetical protein RHMOL_Rhmol03G0268000 [Rhododendron molle]
MASNRIITVSTSPKESGGTGDAANLAKGQCVCSPTTHQGSFRCRFHRASDSTTTTTPCFKRSKSTPSSNHPVTALSPKSVEST